MRIPRRAVYILSEDDFELMGKRLKAIEASDSLSRCQAIAKMGYLDWDTIYEEDGDD